MLHHWYCLQKEIADHWHQFSSRGSGGGDWGGGGEGEV